MESKINSRFSRIMERLKESGFSLSVSKEAGFWDVERNGRRLCRLSAESIVWDDRVNDDETTQMDFGTILYLLEKT